MFRHQTILSLRLAGPAMPSALPVFGHFRDLYFVRNVMEAKQFLLRCLRNMNQAHSDTPDVILVDAGPNNVDIKSELERWMEEHPQFDSIEVMFPAEESWVRRRWKQWIRREGSTAITSE